MPLTILAVLLGLVLGLVLGGSWENLAQRPFRMWPVLVAGLLAQVAAGWGSSGGRSVALVVVSYGLLAAFAAGNLHLAGMAVVVVGLSMNLAVIAANGGMPVRPAALVAAGLARPEELTDLDLGTKRHLARPDDRLVALSDTIGVPGAGQVLSFGDLVLGVGSADVMARLMLGPGLARRGRWAPGVHARGSGRRLWTSGAHADVRRGGRRPSPERT